MNPEDIPDELVERAVRTAYVYTSCGIDCPDQQSRPEAEADAETAEKSLGVPSTNLRAIDLCPLCAELRRAS